MKKTICILLVFLFLVLAVSCSDTGNGQSENNLPVSYQEVLEDFRFMLGTMKDEQFEAYYGGEEKYAFHFSAEEKPMQNWWSMLTYLYSGKMASDDFTYRLWDIDKDGTEELILQQPSDECPVKGIFTQGNDTATLIDAFSGGHYYVRLDADGAILTMQNAGISYQEIRVNSIKDEKLFCMESYVSERDNDGNVCYFNGQTRETIPDETYHNAEIRWDNAARQVIPPGIAIDKSEEA